MGLEKLMKTLEDLNSKIDDMSVKLEDGLNKGVSSIDTSVNGCLNNISEKVNVEIEKHIQTPINMNKEKPFDESVVNDLNNDVEIRVNDIIREPVRVEIKKERE